LHRTYEGLKLARPDGEKWVKKLGLHRTYEGLKLVTGAAAGYVYARFAPYL